MSLLFNGWDKLNIIQLPILLNIGWPKKICHLLDGTAHDGYLAFSLQWLLPSTLQNDWCSHEMQWCYTFKLRNPFVHMNNWWACCKMCPLEGCGKQKQWGNLKRKWHKILGKTDRLNEKQACLLIKLQNQTIVFYFWNETAAVPKTIKRWGGRTVYTCKNIKENKPL